MPRVLIIDDEHEIAELFKRAFEGAGFEVVIAHDGKEGLSQAGIVSPDFILLDIMMPKMDGISVFKNLLSDDNTKDIPVGLYSALDENIKDFIGNDSGTLQKAFAFWEKDKTSPLQIVDEVRKRLNTSERRRE